MSVQACLVSSSLGHAPLPSALAHPGVSQARIQPPLSVPGKAKPSGATLFLYQPQTTSGLSAGQSDLIFLATSAGTAASLTNTITTTTATLANSAPHRLTMGLASTHTESSMVVPGTSNTSIASVAATITQPPSTRIKQIQAQQHQHNFQPNLQQQQQHLIPDFRLPTIPSSRLTYQSQVQSSVQQDTSPAGPLSVAGYTVLARAGKY
ncbi:unnamed protein product [Protopolystoma xenopodis]|uniref:Uncharacterized protein n=1 Tax=Protopolystoma xenopodis TaxID=117903 RepID=A0A3S5CV94_9PLAT|nr:unnamed protein product [Protopolystoma xenopodis]